MVFITSTIKVVFRLLPQYLKHRVFLFLFQKLGYKPVELLINTGETAVMVGSPHADKLQTFAELTGPTGTVLFIEPAQDNFERLAAAGSEYSHVYMDGRGAWSESDTRELLLAHPDNPGDNKVPVDGIEHDNDYRPENYVNSTEIEVERLDVILEDYGEPDYIEIMVNGAELEILNGAIETLSTATPRLLVKGHARRTDTDESINREIADLLESYGFRTVIGAGDDETVGATDNWDRRDSDVYAYK